MHAAQYERKVENFRSSCARAPKRPGICYTLEIADNYSKFDLLTLNISLQKINRAYNKQKVHTFFLHE